MSLMSNYCFIGNLQKLQVWWVWHMGESVNFFEACVEKRDGGRDLVCDSGAPVAERWRGEAPGGGWLCASCVEGRCPTPTWRGTRGLTRWGTLDALRSKVPCKSFIARWWRKEVTGSFQFVFFNLGSIKPKTISMWGYLSSPWSIARRSGGRILYTNQVFICP